MSKDIKNIAMLVNLGIAYWTANAADESVIDDIAKRSKSEKDQHAYRKILVKPDSINAVKAVRSRARAYHFDRTLPWVDGGTRILPSAFYREYSDKMHEFRGEYEGAVSTFIRQYSALKGEARKRLGSLFKDEDYPSEASLRSKFSWEMKVFPIPAGDDWRVEGMASKENSEIKKQIDEQVAAAMQVATQDLFKRLHKVVKDFMDAMKKSSDPTFRDSIVGNIKELCSVMRTMNVAHDDDLEKMVKQIESTLAKLDPAELRDDKKKRKAAADSADEILRKMAGYLGS